MAGVGRFVPLEVEMLTLFAGRHWLFVAAVSLAMTAATSATELPIEEDAPTAEYGFSTPTVVHGSPGERVQFEVFLTWHILTNVENSHIQAWAHSVVIADAEVIAINFDDLTIPTDAGAIPVRPSFYASYDVASDPEDPEDRGLAGALISPGYPGVFHLQPVEKTPVVRVILETEMPPDGRDALIELRYQDDLVPAHRQQPRWNEFHQTPGPDLCPTFVNASIRVRSQGGIFLRGDANEDGRHDISDAAVILNFLFRGNVETQCTDAFDTNDDGRLQVTDAVMLFSYLFRGGTPTADPFLKCGRDTTDDLLSCDHHTPCS